MKNIKKMVDISPAAIILIGAVITAFLSFLAQQKQDDSDEADKNNLRKDNKAIQKELNITRLELKEQANLNAKLQEIRSKEIQGLQSESAEQSREYAKKVELYAETQKESDAKIIALQASQIAKTEEIARLNRELAQLSTETLNTVIAKDSYCYVNISMPPFPNFKQAGVTVHHVGKYPLKKLEISIINTDNEYDHTYSGNINQPPAIKAKEFHPFNNPYVKKVEILSPGEMINLENIEVEIVKQKSFNVVFRADNGAIWYQRIVIREVKEYPENILLRQQGNVDHVQANQLYKLVNNDPDKYNYSRVESILQEGVGFFWVNSIPTSKKNDFMKWGVFPRLEGELSPFNGNSKDSSKNYDGLHKLHWDGMKNVGATFGGSVKTVYQE